MSCKADEEKLDRGIELPLRSHGKRWSGVALVALLSAAAPLAAATSPNLVFACGPSNDLYQVLTANGHIYPRRATPAEAVEAASGGGGVLVLAGGYPETLTEIPAGVYEAAAAKGVRLYVEYPSAVPGLALGEPRDFRTGPYGVRYDRAVVSSGAFGPELPKRSILAIHDCRYVPVAVEKTHLVLARVVGFDQAVLGLPKEVFPILFEHPNGKLMVATTSLSNFVTGRYAPSAAWGRVWGMILSWLQGGRAVAELKWTPMVLPSYGRAQALPADAERQAVRRTAEWYLNSRLLVHESWQPQRLPTGRKDPIPLDWGMGDGSMGIAEGFNARILPNGRHAVARDIRNDCANESAMLLSASAVLFGKEKYERTARNLHDFILHKSVLCAGPRADEASPSYGIMGWAISVEPGKENMYWGDDNARSLLGVMASAALLKTDQWDEALVRGILGNFRTTGPQGFRNGLLGEQEIQKNGWRYYWEAKRVSYSPHYESYLWPTYLWLYDKTGYQPLLARAKAGIYRMMEAYPDKWAAECGRMEEERAHMLLPLAWLVRVEDTPLHRQWLDWMVKYLQNVQHSCGAIPQHVDKPQTSNDQYGTGEAPIVYQTGDPATDTLYTMGFAISGMHEAAAATGNPEYGRVEDRMADFLTRIQTRCEARAELDGCWYRIFDYGKWDYWGSDGDVGWGVWSAETGWAQPWVAGTLALRQMKTNLWDLTKSSKAGRHFEKYRKLMLPAAIIEEGPGKADVPAAAFPLDKQRSQTLPDKVPSDRAQISLTGTWSFQADRRNEGESAGWFTDGYDAKSWQPVEVPVAFDNCGTNMDRYAGVGWFRKQVYVPEPFGGRRIVLQFEGINYNAKVWVNGKLVGENHDAFLPFSLPINDAVKIGAKNMITVRVDNLRTRGQFPLFEGWLGQGGFLREAYLVAADETLLTGTFIQAEPATGGGHLSVRAFVTNGVTHPRAVQIQVRVIDANGRQLTVLGSSSVAVEPGTVGELIAEGVVPEVQPWSPNTPVLYSAHVVLMSDGRTLDSQTRRIGFRRIEIKDAKLLLNGQPQFLMGFNRHEDSPRTGMAVDLKQAREDFTAIKKLGGNFVRFCHYPHHPGELDLCDELGLLVLAENAMNEWGHVDHGDPNGGFSLKPEDAPLIVENAKRTLRKVVQRDNHHPSIILWSISNENAEERADVAAGNGELIQYGQTLDKSRPWTHVSNCFNKDGWESFYRFDNVIVVNIYAGHKVSLARTNLEAKLPEATKFMEEVLAKLHRQFPQKPIVIGESGYFGGESGAEGAEIQAIVSEAEFKGLNAPYAAGCAFWAYARHPWPWANTPLSTYGYVSRDRKTRFPALTLVERLFKERAGLTNSPPTTTKGR